MPGEKVLQCRDCGHGPLSHTMGFCFGLVSYDGGDQEECYCRAFVDEDPLADELEETFGEPK